MTADPSLSAPARGALFSLSPRACLVVLPLTAPLPPGPPQIQGLDGALAIQKLDETALLLLAPPQPGCAAGAELRLAGPGPAWQLHPAATLAEALPAPSPAQLQALLCFVAGRALGSLRARDDAELAAACLALAAAFPLPEASPLAMAGPALGLWPWPASEPQPGFLLTPRGWRLLRSRSGRGVLLPAVAAGGLLLHAGAATPLRLTPPGSGTPWLAELLQRPGAAATLQAGIAELAEAAPQDALAAAQLRAMAALPVATPPRIAADPHRPLGAALELAVDDQGGGLLLRGWIRDPLRLVERVLLRSPWGEEALPAARRHPYARPDLAKTFQQAPHGGAAPQPGFVAWLPRVAVPAAQWGLRLGLTTGECLDLTAPPGLLPPAQARDALLTALPVAALTPAMMDDCLLPALARMQAAFLAQRAAPEVIRIGPPIAAPRVSVVVPLYRNLRFVRFQIGHFARDPAMRQTELVYVLDSPEQRADIELLLRSLHAVQGMPVTLVVQAGNYGFSSACNAGAAAARAPRLLMLNSDVIPAARGWLPLLEAALESDPGLAMVGPKLLTEEDSVQHAGLFFERHGPLEEWFNNHYWKGAPRRFPPLDRPRRVPGVTGAAMLLDRARFEAVGGFTTDYAIGDYEDSDLCLKLRAAGGEIGYEPRAELYHFERQSIRDHAVHDRNLATALNRRLHQQRWGAAIEALMARPEFAQVQA